MTLAESVDKEEALPKAFAEMVKQYEDLAGELGPARDRGEFNFPVDFDIPDKDVNIKPRMIYKNPGQVE